MQLFPFTHRRFSKAEFILASIDETTVQEFKNAWKSVGAGTDSIECLILLFRKLDGTLMVRSLPLTNEVRGFKFSWNPATIGIVHTHPNDCAPRPTPEDKRIADRFRVPMITLTSSGMYLYDPETKTLSLVLKNVDWLNPAKWNERERMLALK